MKDAEDALKSLISTVQGYQSMPGFSIHPMVKAMIDNIQPKLDVKEEPIKLFEVWCPATIEDSKWNIAAASAKEAVDLYVKAVIEEEIALDFDDMVDAETICCMPIAGQVSRGILPWVVEKTLTFKVDELELVRLHMAEDDEPEI